MRFILIIISAIIVDEICWRLILHSVKGYARMEERIYDMSKYKNNDHRVDKQTVYKVEGDFNGDIKGDNVTVILMGNGNFNGNISSKDGEVVVIKGNINGDVKANKVLCPTDPTTDNKDQHICKSCYHYVQTPTGSYCTESSALGDALPVGCNICKSYDGTGKTTKYKSDCARFSNRSGLCQIFHVPRCEIEYKYNCPYKIKRDECKTENNTTKHNPAKDVESPKLQVETLWSCDIPQDASPYERVDFVYDGDKCVNRYKSLALANVTCPHCRKSFSKDFKVVTTVIDGEVSNTEIENYGGYILD